MTTWMLEAEIFDLAFTNIVDRLRKKLNLPWPQKAQDKKQIVTEAITELKSVTRKLTTKKLAAELETTKEFIAESLATQADKIIKDVTDMLTEQVHNNNAAQPNQPKMDIKPLIKKFVKNSKGELDADIFTEDLAQEIRQHFLVDPATISDKFFTDKYWSFLSDDEDVMRDLINDFASATCETDDELDAIMEDPMWYRDDAIDWYCDDHNATLIVEEDGIMVFVSNNLIDNEFISA